MNIRPGKTTLPMLIAIWTVAHIAACASIGSPDGGPYDETPPKVVKCTPANGAKNNKNKKIRLTFDEFIVLENASEKVVVSPPQIEMPEISTSGKSINVNLFDSLKANTTYTIDFADAIVDNNEGNPMGKFTYSFSTGSIIDTMEVSGTLLEAENLEPIKGLLVGLHSDLSDTAFTTRPFDRVSRTDSRGQFTIKGVAPGKFRIFALEDADGNFLFNQKSEKIAFDTTVIVPTCAPDLRQDTVWIDSVHIDTIRAVPFTHYYPDNIVLRAFKEEFNNLHLLKTERPDPYSFKIYFTAPSDTIPTIKGLNFNSDSAFVLERSYNNDTLTYWIPDTLLAYQDTLSMSLTYLDTDTAYNLVWRTDTLDIVAKQTRSRMVKALQERIEKWEKEQERLKKRQKERYVETPPPTDIKPLGYKQAPAGSLAPNQNIKFTFDEPLAQLDTAALHFFKQVDTLWVQEPFLFLPVEHEMRSYMLYAEWQPDMKYKFEADTCAFTSVLGKVSDPIKKEISVSPMDAFSALYIQLILPDTGAVVQLMDKSDKVVRSQRAIDNRADFYYLKPGDYYLRLFIDRNGDGVWNTGDYAKGIQPEEVFYFPKPIAAKAKWEIEQDWNVRAIPLVKQKAIEITKQKPDKEKEIKNRNAERERNKR